MGLYTEYDIRSGNRLTRSNLDPKKALHFLTHLYHLRNGMIDLLSTHDFYEYKMTRNLFEMCEQM